jgi:hypothetical protein
VRTPRLSLFLFTLTLFLIYPASTPHGASTPATFAVATWNVHTGRGAVMSPSGAPFDMSTADCTDPARPKNAWGTGFFQEVLNADVAQDPAMVALGVQEAWGTCASVANIKAVLQWKAASPERGGIGLIARYGIIGPWDTWQIAIRNVAGATEDRWVVGGNVCVDPDCIRTVYMWTTHLQATTDEEWPQHVGRVLDVLSNQPLPHLFMGDINAWQNDQWSPRTNCGSSTAKMAEAITAIIRADYRDAWAATQRGEGWTATVDRPGCGAMRNGGAYKRVDYIWTRGLQPLSTTRIGVADPGAAAASDHVGVKAVIFAP